MKKYCVYRVLIFIGIISFLSCKKDIPNYTRKPENFRDVFDLFWNQVNMNYVYWDIDTTKWDKVYYRFMPVFESLDLNNSNDVKKSVQLFRQLCDGLIDGHFYIDFTHPDISDSLVYPAFDQKQNKQGFHQPYPYYFVVKKYLNKGYIEGTDNISSPYDAPVYALSGILEDSILYFHCSSFKLLQSYSSQQNNAIKPVLNYFISTLKNLPPSINGIIIDIRNNSGGDLSDLNFFVGNLIDEPVHFGYTRHKSGNGRLDYSPWINAFVYPQQDSKKNSLPIIVLIDNFSASMAEIVAMAIKCLPNSLCIGESSFGATGITTSYEVYNDGQFEVNGFMKVKASSVMFKNLNDYSFEGKGILPDIFIPFNRDKLNEGHDMQLERAISEIY